MTIEKQLAEYFEHQDELYPPISSGEVTGPPVRVSTRVASTANPWWAGAAAAVVIFVVGAVAVFSALRPNEQPPSQQATTTTAVNESANTTVADAVESVVTTTDASLFVAYEEMETPTVVSEVVSETDGFGSVTWTRYEAVSGALPSAEVLFDPDLGYFAYPQFNRADPNAADRVYEWHSDDAITWERRPIPEFDGYYGVAIERGWGSAVSKLGLWAVAWVKEPSGSHTYRYFLQSGDEWIPVTFDDSSRPGSEGLPYEVQRGAPITSGDVTIFATTGFTGPESNRVGDLWIADDRGVLKWVPNPTPGNQFDWGFPILPLPAGGFAIHDEREDSNVTNVTFWTSQDGVFWTEAGTTEFPELGRGGTTFTSWTGGLRAFIGSETAPTSVMESIDAITWWEVPAPARRGQVFDTSFGHLDLADEPIDGDLLISVSTDGFAWEAVDVPPDLALPRISGTYHRGVAGDLFYQTIVAESGELHFWIGHFD